MSFNSLGELKDRLEPALKKRVSDLNILGFKINEENIWNDLVIKWRNTSGLALSDMVDDILKYMPRIGSDNND